jgi:sulfur carrier protein
MDVIMLNGERLEGFLVGEDDASSTVAALLAHLGVEGSQRGVAVAVNDEVVPRSQWATHVLRGGDRVELIRATQGG